MSEYSMTGQIGSDRRRAAAISSIADRTRCSTTAKTSSTVRPEAAIWARRAVLISRVAARRSVGVCSQCGRLTADPFWEALLTRTDSRCRCAFKARGLTNIGTHGADEAVAG